METSPEQRLNRLRPGPPSRRSQNRLVKLGIADATPKLWTARAAQRAAAAAGVGRGGVATETNCVASSTPGPNGVWSDRRYGTTTRVPAIGASQTSMSRWAIKYLIPGRSGT